MGFHHFLEFFISLGGPLQTLIFWAMLEMFSLTHCSKICHRTEALVELLEVSKRLPASLRIKCLNEEAVKNCTVLSDILFAI